MKKFKDYLNEIREVFLSKEPLNEMPMRNSVSKEWAQKTIDDLWELAQDEVIKVGKIGSEEVFTVSVGSTIYYYFLVKSNKPVFAASFINRVDLRGLQEDNIAKKSSENSAERLYKFICNHKRKSIISSASHSVGMEKIWKQFMKKYKFEIYDDDTGKQVSSENVYPSNKVIRIFFK